jgi:ABC-type transporter Mla maintaining outer membrane lipid asymmetry permease subunit MlaE
MNRLRAAVVVIWALNVLNIVLGLFGAHGYY